MATFDDAALSKLTTRIDSKLAESKKTKGKTSEGKRKREQNADDTQPPSKKRNNDKKDKLKLKLNGRQNGSRPKPQSKKEMAPASSKPEPDLLLDEIRALGGDEEDYKLVADLNSDDEKENDQKKPKDLDKSLRQELAQFAAGLGFDQVSPGSASEESEADADNAGSDGEFEGSGQEIDGSGTNGVSDSQRGPKRKTIFEPRPDWHAAHVKSLPSPFDDDEIAPYMSTISHLKDYAKQVLEQDSAAYGATFSASSSRKFMSTIMSSGTVSDKISALTLAIQESPVHNFKAFETLLSLGAKRSRGQALAALSALVDLLGPGMILPSDRRLRTFSSQLGLIGTLQNHSVKSWSANLPLPGKITKEHLIMWVFEDWLKDAYFKMIQSLEVWCDDEVEYARTKALDLVFALLRDKPEQESNLLHLLVNKLGDREKKIASRASYLILQLLTTHPGMKRVAVNTVEQDVLFRPGQNIRAKYYAINTLNQTILSGKEPDIADSLLRIYFGIFIALLKSGELSQIDGALENSKDEKKKRNHKAKSSRKKETKEQIGTGKKDAAEKLVSAILTGVNRAVPFSQADQSTLESHLDTLFRITHSSNFNTSIQALMLIQQLSANRQLATERFYRTLYESLLDPRIITSSKHALYLNLLYRSLKADVDVRRVKAFVKRMLQVLNLHQPSFVCGIIYLITELSSTFPDLKALLNDPEEYDIEKTVPGVALDAPNGPIDQAPSSTPDKPEGIYDGRKRDPEYSNAHRSCLWELLPFLRHFHPSVDVYAGSLLKGEKKTTQKPELANHTLIAFLDKFVYKNAKAADSKGTSIMQPVAATGQGQVLLSNKPSSRAIGSVNTESFWNRKSEDVAVEDVFFHEYFAQIGKPGQAEREKKKKAKKAASGDADDEEVEEDEIWQALVASQPGVQGDSDDDAGFDDMADYDDSDEEDGAQRDSDDVGMSDDEDMLDILGESDLDTDEDDEDSGMQPTTEGDAEKGPNADRKARRKAMKNLPVFASAEDYAEMIARDEDGV